MIEKIVSLNSINNKISQDLSDKDNKLNEYTDEIKLLEKETEKLKKKLKEAAEETDNLREIIAKDQLRIKELKEFKEKALDGTLDLNYIQTKNSENLSAKGIVENQDSLKTSEYNILLDKLKDEKSKSKVLCDEFRKLQENISTLKLENSKKERVIETNMKMIDELKVRLKNKIKLDEIIIQNKNKDSYNLSNIGICNQCNNLINNINNNNFRLLSIESANSPLDFQRGRSQTNINAIDSQSNHLHKLNSTTLLRDENTNSNKAPSYLGTQGTLISNITDSRVESNEANLNKIKENNCEGKIRVTFEQFNLCKLLIVENLLLNYQLSQSISLNFVIEVLLKNFNFLFNTIFLNENQTIKETDKKNLKDGIKSINIINNTNTNSVHESSNGEDRTNGPFKYTSNISGLNQTSIFHEFLEDVILKIYDIANKNKTVQDESLKTKNNGNIKGDQKSLKENTAFSFGKTIANIFSSKRTNQTKSEQNENDVTKNLSKEDFSFELNHKITSEISENNILFNLINAQRPTKLTIQDLFNGFRQKFGRFFDFEFLNLSDKNAKYYEVVNIKLGDYLNNEIKSVLIENLRNFNSNSKNKISLLIDKVSQNIQDGLLLNSINKTPLYNFKYFDKEYSEFNFILRNSQNQISEEKSLSTDSESENFLKCSEINETNNSQTDSISEILGYCTNENVKNTIIINLSQVEKILRCRHTFDYFSFLVKSQNSDLKKIFFKGDIKKNIELKSFNAFFLNILLYNKNINRLSFTDVYLSCDTQIRDNESLRRLSIYKEPVNQSLQELVNFLNYSNNLRYINISNCFIGDEGLKFFSKNFSNYNLVELNLSKNHLGKNSGFYLAELIPKLHNLETLILADNSLTDPGLTSFLTAISLLPQDLKKSTLRYLDLSNNSLSENECRLFVDYLQKYHSLEEVNLSGNALLGPAANSIGIYLKLVKGLKKIDLSKCEMNDESSPLLIKNLDYSIVESIILDSNPLGQIGAILLANMLRINKNMKFISLKNCEITGFGMTLLAKNCENNTYLKEIDLRNNKIGYEEYKTLKQLIEGKTFNFLLDDDQNLNFIK